MHICNFHVPDFLTFRVYLKLLTETHSFVENVQGWISDCFVIYRMYFLLSLL